jgi:hypothetical protein
MVSYITKRYAPLLTKFDVQMLFNWLKDAYGSVAKAARVTGVQRKTVYDWEGLKEEVRLETKLKVLEQSMKLNQNRTLEFLIRKNDDNLKEVLQHYIRYIYENSMKASSKEDLAKNITFFHDIQKNHRGAVFDSQLSEIEEMNKALAARAKEFEIDLPERSIHLIRPEVLADKILVLLKIVETTELEVEEMRKKFGLPPEFVENVCKALNYLNPSEDVSREYEEVASEIALSTTDGWFDFTGNTDYLKPKTPLNAMRAEKKEV